MQARQVILSRNQAQGAHTTQFLAELSFAALADNYAGFNEVSFDACKYERKGRNVGLKGIPLYQVDVVSTGLILMSEVGIDAQQKFKPRKGASAC